MQVVLGKREIILGVSEVQRWGFKKWGGFSNGFHWLLWGTHWRGAMQRTRKSARDEAWTRGVAVES